MKNKIFMIIVVGLLCVGSYYGYCFVKREIQKRAFKHAIEEGCELVVKKYEQEQDDIAQDVARLIDHIEKLDQDAITEELEVIHEELQERDYLGR